MHVVILYQFFSDAGQPGDSLMRDLARALLASGHKVTVVTGEAGYMTRRPAQDRQWWQVWQRGVVAGVPVVRCLSLANPRGGKVWRMMGYLAFTLTGAAALLAVARPSLIFASSPPIYSSAVALMIGRLRGSPLLLEIRDVWSDSIGQIATLERQRRGPGIWSLAGDRGPLLRLTRWLERLLYRKSRGIVALTGAIKRHVVAQGGAPDKVVEARCGVDLDLLYPDPAAGRAVRAAQDWNGRPLALYVGTLGLAHDMETLVEAARLLGQRNADCHLVLVGDGIMRSATVERIQAAGLDNIEVKAPVPRAEINAMINAADLCIVSVKDVAVFKEALPTKLFDAMAAGRPVLHCLNGQAQRIVEEAGAGWHYQAGDAADLAEKIVEALSDLARLREAGGRGRSYAEAHFGIAARNAALIQLMSRVSKQ